MPQMLEATPRSLSRGRQASLLSLFPFTGLRTCSVSRWSQPIRPLHKEARLSCQFLQPAGGTLHTEPYWSCALGAHGGALDVCSRVPERPQVL